MSYTNVFGGTTLYPSDVSYLAVALSADISLDWPLEGADATYPAARVIDVTASGAYAVILPDATLTGPGQTILFNCLSASATGFLLKDFAGNTIATIGIGEQWQVYLAGTSTAAGSWRVFRYGASTATVQASALAGYGLTVTGGNLSQSLPLTSFNSSPRTALLTDRASIMLWNGTGSGTLVLPAAATAGNNFFISAHNAGGGDLTIDPAGTELIDGGAAITLHPGDSATFVTDGLAWYTLGLGQQAVFAFDYTSITVTGGTYTLTGSELNRIAYNFVGTLTSNVDIVVPATVQQYWVSNATTGPFNLYLKTATGSRVVVAQGARGIYYCNGVNVVDADTSTISLPVNPTDGGTGITSYTAGDLLYASGPTTLSKLAGTAVGNVLLTGGVGSPPSYGKVGLATHVSGTLPVANGGTGVATAPANGQLLIGNGTGFSLATITPGSGVSITNSAGGITISATGAGGTVTSVNASGSTTGLTFSGGPITGSGTLTLGGTLVIGNGGTGATTAAGARTALDVPSTTGSGASGTWGINVSGNAATATTATNQSGGTVNATTGSFSGNVGVGIAIPPDRLNVSDGTVNFQFKPLGGASVGYFGVRSNHALALTTNDTERLRVDTNGNVGIGTTSPTNSLHIEKAGGSIARFRDVTSGADTYLLSDSGGTALIQTQALPLKLSTSNTTRLHIDAGGNVGIGTTSPLRKLSVSDTNAYLGLYATSSGNKRTGIVFSGSGTDQFEMGVDLNLNNLRNWYLFDNVASAVRVMVDANGNFGIGTNSPATLFDVSGNFQVASTGALVSASRADAAGYKGLPPNNTTGGYTIVLGDMGKMVTATGTVTVPLNSVTAFPIGSAVTVFNSGTGAITVSPAGGVSLTLAGSTTSGARTLAQNALATLVKITTDSWVISGAGVS